jgi:hypothetical protein
VTVPFLAPLSPHLVVARQSSRRRARPRRLDLPTTRSSNPPADQLTPLAGLTDPCDAAEPTSEAARGVTVEVEVAPRGGGVTTRTRRAVRRQCGRTGVCESAVVLMGVLAQKHEQVRGEKRERVD